MITTITDGVKVSVETIYQPEYSNPANDHYMFAYKISIENVGISSVQLLRRHWEIFDSNGAKREVEGEGVVGQQPVILSGQSYQYTSAANLTSDIGKMYGTYEMENLFDKKKLTVAIPEFKLVATPKLN